VLRLGHLNLTVSDVNRAASFYATWFGFDQVLAGYPDNTRFVTDGSGFELALHEGVRTEAASDWHFGFLASDARSVRDVMAAMQQAGTVMGALEDTDDYVGFKCRDPDNHEIEVYFEPRA
jgi:catechol 2,3-dioxygenase-like lactoylglutathione lyase family enzyme